MLQHPRLWSAPPRRTLFVTLVTTFVLATPLVAAAPPATALAPAQFPDRVEYRGRALSASGAALEGKHSFQVRYFDGQRELLVERFDAVVVTGGRFRVELGTGATLPGSDAQPAASLRELFARTPKVAMEISIDGVRQAPRVAVLPAGHSAESRLILAGRASADDPAAHTKGYRAKSAATAIQAAILSPAGAGTGATNVGDGVFEMEVRGPWVSAPLRDLPAIQSPELFTGEPAEVNRPRHETLVDEEGYLFGTRTKKIVDPLVESARRPAALQTPTPILNFAGIDNIQGFYPPDTEGAVGPNHYAQVVNVSYAIFDKSGVLAGGPWDTNVLWAGAVGSACAGHNDGDAIFNYDQFADRWMLTQFAVQPGQIVCFAISQTGDPLGAYYLYEVTTPRFPDYFKIGIWPDPDHNAYYMGTNSGFQGQYDVFAVDRENMLAGLPARPTQVKQNHVNLMMPADVDGTTPPPADSPGLFYTFRDGGEPYFGSPPADSLDLWAFDVDWATPANTTYTMIHSFTNAAGGFADFNWSICGFFVSNCLSQPGTAVKIDSASWWPMQRLAYRNFTGHESLVGTWTVDVTATPDLAAPRWFELRRSGGPWSIYQQGTHSPDGDHRWMPSIAQDRDGNIAIGYSVVNAPNNLYPSIRYATRAAGDPLGTLQAEQTLFVGTGAQTGSAGRWGDYSSMTVDPTDDCTFWYSTEYLETTGGAPWKTRVGTFKVPGCGGMAVTPTVQEVCGTVGSVDFAIALFEEFTVSTDLSVTGCPATCGFSDDPVVAPDDDSVLTVSGLGALSNGIYNFSVTAQDSDSTRDVPLALTLWAAAPGGTTLTLPANGASNVSRRPTFTWTPASGAATYLLEVDDDAGFGSPVYTQTVTGTSHQPAVDLPTNSQLYWRVQPDNTCGSGAVSSTFGFITEALAGDCSFDSAPNVAFAQGFESGAAGWTSSGTGNTWAQSTARFHGGAASWKAVDSPAVSDQRLVSPAIALPAGTGITLQYWSFKDIENNGTTGCYDGAILETSTDNVNFTQVTSFAADPYRGPVSTSFSNPIGGLNAWCEATASAAWVKTVTSLDALAGQTVYFRFRLATDVSVGREGWYVDDVAIQTCVPDGLFADGFETGDRSRWSSYSN